MSHTMWIVVLLIVVMLPVYVCSSRVHVDEDSNLVLDAGQGNNITAFGNALMMNSEVVYTSNQVLALVNGLQTQFNASLALLNATKHAQLQSLLDENRRLAEQLAVLNATLNAQQTNLVTLASQTNPATTNALVNTINQHTTQISRMDSKLDVLQPQIQQICTSSNPSVSLPLFQQLNTTSQFNGIFHH